MRLVSTSTLPKRRVPVGVVLSQDGPYAVTARAMTEGIRVAQAELASCPDLDISLDLICLNPAGRLENYPRMCEELLDRGVRHVIGCNTSASRKAVIPLFESRNALLWYTAHYEGFETSSNIVYTGAAPNQHIVPLIDYLLGCGHRRSFSVGSNYVWAWENDRILREMLLANGGDVTGVHLIPVGERCPRALMDEILDGRPDFVFNNLIGISAYDFFQQFRQACAARGIDQAREIPVVSCSLSEPELAEIGPEYCDGHIVSSAYFSTIASEQNRRFIETCRRHNPDSDFVSNDAESAYLAALALGRALNLCQTDRAADVLAAAKTVQIGAPQGKVWFDAGNMHLFLWPRIGRSTKEGLFEIVWESEEPVAPDPYLTRTMAETEILSFEPLRLVR